MPAPTPVPDRPPPHPAPHPAVAYRAPRRLLLARLAVVALAVTALAAIAYVGWWFSLAMQIRDGVTAWAAQERADGRVAGWDRLELSGFPFAIRIDVDAPRLGEPAAARPWRWQAAAAVAHVRPWRPDTVAVDLSGRHELEVDGIAYRAEARRLGAEAVAGPWRWPRQVAVAADGLTLQRADGGTVATVGRLDAELKRAVAPSAAADAVTGRLDVSARNAAVPQASGLPLGRLIERLDINARLLGPLKEGPLVAALADWRDAGGTVTLDRLALAYGPVRASAAGTLALDGALQPAGSLAARVRGFFELLDALHARGVVRTRDVSMARVVLGVLARTPPDGGPPVLSVPLTLRERTLFAGPVQVARLPAVHWRELAPPPTPSSGEPAKSVTDGG